LMLCLPAYLFNFISVFLNISYYGWGFDERQDYRLLEWGRV